MPEVTFYVLASADEQQRLLFVCKLVEKAYRMGNFCYLLAENDAQAQKLDDLLWTFRQGSFIPHQRYDGSLPEFDKTILIGVAEPPPSWQQIVVNLSLRGFSAFEHVERILEVLDDDPDIKAEGRARYRRYLQAGAKLETHNIS